MAQQTKTPGVYIRELDEFPHAVIQAPTAIPAFVGFTESASRRGHDLRNTPVQMSSMAEFREYFADPAGTTGGAPAPCFDYASHPGKAPPFLAAADAPRFYLYHSLQLFFDNGGGECMIVSIGTYDDVAAQDGKPAAQAFLAGLEALEKDERTTLIVMPDAAMLDTGGWKAVSQAALRQCGALRDRFAILDVREGWRALEGGVDDPVTGTDGFYDLGDATGAERMYGAAYYPWLNTAVVGASAIDFGWLSSRTLPALQADLLAEAAQLFPPRRDGSPDPKLAPYLAIVAGLATAQGDARRSSHQALLAHSPRYRNTVEDIAASANLLPPSGAMAGVYVRNDNAFGVNHAPANTTIISALAPAVPLDDDAQGGLNTPLNGMAVNAIRTFPGRGPLVWGARTLDGNSQDWRYVSVRRTAIMLEQSIRTTLRAFAAQANDAVAWHAVKRALDDFLTAQWKAGVLAGTGAADAFRVRVGLGADADAAVMKVEVEVAIVRPAEFIEISLEQRLQAG